MLLRAVILACTLAPVEPAEVPTVTTSTTPAGLDVVIVRVPPQSERELHDALRVRLPTARVLPFRNESFAEIGGQPFVYLEITTDDEPEPTTRLLFVLSDGRAYVRDVQPEPDQPARSIAATIAVTLGAIEEERLLPDRTQVAVPRPEPEPEPPEPEPLETTPPEPTPPEPQPTPARRSDPPPVEHASPTPDDPPRAHVGVGATFAGLFGLAPPTPRARFPIGATVHAAMRLPIGVAVEAGLRGSARAHAGYRLLRLRGHVGAGFAWARRRLELSAVAGPTVEGWTVRDQDRRAPASGPSDGRVPPLFGAAAAITAGVLMPTWTSSRVTVRVAARAELAASALPSGSSARVIEVGPPSQTIFTAGGMEASVGLDVRVWIPIPLRRVGRAGARAGRAPHPPRARAGRPAPPPRGRGVHRRAEGP